MKLESEVDVRRFVYRMISEMLGLRRGSKLWPRSAPTLLDVISDEIEGNKDYVEAKRVVRSVDNEMKRRLSELEDI